MSGVAALWTSAAVKTDILQSFLTSMPHRAKDGVATWYDGAIALSLSYTRRFIEEPMSAELTKDGPLFAIADIRLDNRDELLSELSLPETTCDTIIALHAYQVWNAGFAAHLLGDFAIIILDQSKHRLVAARDHMGIKPLFWRLDAAGLALASELRPLCDLREPFKNLANGSPVEDQILGFIANRLSQGHIILHPGLERLPAGHTLVYDGTGAPKIEAYWRPTPNLVAPQDISAGRLNALLTDAVRCRMRGVKRVAAALSGGLDSSSIAGLAAQISKDAGLGPLSTFSAVFDNTPDLNERPYIESALKKSHMTPHFVSFDDYAPLEDITSSIAQQSRLFSAPGLRMTSQLCRVIKDAGFDAYLDGHGGDEVISHGFGRLAELEQAKEWRGLWAGLGAFAKLYGHSRIWLFLKAFLKFSGIKGAYRLGKALTVFERLSQRYQTSPIAPGKTLPAAIDGVPGAEFPTELEEHLSVLRSVNQTECLEILELNAARQGISVLFPFFDKRVVEYCLSVPSHQKLDQGWFRLSLRQAMEGVLPDDIRWRKDKFDFTPHLIRGVVLNHRAFIEAILNDPHDHAAHYYDMSKVRQSFQKLIRRGKRASGYDLQTVWRAVVLSVWLKQQQGPDLGT